MEERTQKTGVRILLTIIPVLLAAASIYVLYNFSVASLQYKRKSYTMKGKHFLKGVSISGEAISPNAVLWLFIIGMGIVIVFSLLRGILKETVRAEIYEVGALVAFISAVVTFSNLADTLSAFKNVTAQNGLFIIMGLSLLCVLIGVWDLRQSKVLCALDFMIMPGFLYFIINNYIPMFGIYIAFKKVDYSKGLWGSDWVGLDNFKYLFSTTDAFIITRNTILYNVAFIVLGLISGIVVGICLAELYSKLLQKTYQTVILLPQLISFVIVSYIVYALLSNETGLITKLIGGSVNFYSEPKYWPFILIFINIWKQLGYNGIVFLSSIVGIDYSMYEAARVDGASKWQQIRSITIPQLKPTIMTLFLLQVGRIFYSDFGLFYQVPLNAGALMDVTNTIDTYVYRALMVNNNISTASAASTYQAVVGFVLVLVVNMIVRKVDRENAMF